jgi:hypothetical protein
MRWGLRQSALDSAQVADYLLRWPVGWSVPARAMGAGGRATLLRLAKGVAAMAKSRAKQPTSTPAAGLALMGVRHIVHLDTLHKIRCEHCDFGDCWPRVTFAEAVNHYIEAHGYRLLHIGTEIDSEGDVSPRPITVAVLGHDSPPPPPPKPAEPDFDGIPFETLDT